MGVKKQIKKGQLKEQYKESLILLRDLADIQNGPPLETVRKEWEELMTKVYDFLERHEDEFDLKEVKTPCTCWLKVKSCYCEVK